ncbi:Panacea domain-containing protein [Thioclava sp. F36-7]|uniref:Panacea domain-containing protein n=1 Tax=Thioclava sp. F36-7 TaxID=1915317 RepID=UPI000996D9A1|nr:Panacea domain-containing protein [Thioclava sp. F36-7]OOY10585.1 hypothetical protein BMI89_01390 [Thioclava sp. F36-7]
MNKISEVAAYICEHYPHKSELSKARLTKLVYLADWKSCEKRGEQITPIQWYFHNFGPYVDDVIDTVSSEAARFSVIRTKNVYGDEKTEIQLKPNEKSTELSGNEKLIIDQVIEDTKRFYWKDFIKHVYATPPIADSDRYSYLDLKSFAEKLSTSRR